VDVPDGSVLEATATSVRISPIGAPGPAGAPPGGEPASGEEPAGAVPVIAGGRRIS
jgi:hypothetical protein